MRRRSRIKPFCEELAKEWEKLPDQRFGQFMSNVLGLICEEHGDVWFPEDKAMIGYIKEAVAKMAPVLPGPELVPEEEEKTE